MTKGWFVGDFTPSILQTGTCEVGVKHYVAGTREPWHEHRVAQEITCIVVGEARMGGRPYRAGDILLLEPGEASDFEAITDVITVVVKLPSVLGDKYPVAPPAC